MTIFTNIRAAAFLAAMLGAAAAPAAIVSGTITGGTVASLTPAGQFIQLDPSAGSFTVGSDNFNTNNLYGFNEQQNVTLASNISVVFGEGLGSGTIAAGTIVSSHYFVFDPVTVQSFRATLVFDQPILGFARSAAQLNGSNTLGAASVTYTAPGFFGLEPGLDLLAYNPLFPNQVKIFLRDSSPGDTFRVFTAGAAPAPVPEPAAWALMIGGFLTVGGVARRRNRLAARLA